MNKTVIAFFSAWTLWMTPALAAALEDGSDERTPIHSADELPPRSYAIEAAPSELLDDPVAMGKLAARLEGNLLDDLERYHFFDEAYKALEQHLGSAPDVLFVAASGNADADNRFIRQIPAPIDLPNLLTVGAVDQAGREAPFTSYGKVDVYANGVEVESLIPGGGRLPASGTSMAAPQVTNLAARLLALEPDLDPAELRRLILNDADEHAVGDGRTIRLLNPARSLALLTQRGQGFAKCNGRWRLGRIGRVHTSVPVTRT